MGILPVLLLLSLGFAACAVLIFLAALRRGQFDDLDTPAHRVLWDEKERAHEDPDRTVGRGPGSE